MPQRRHGLIQSAKLNGHDPYCYLEDLLFKRFAQWPLVSKVTLMCGPMLIGLGCYFSSQKARYAMLVPCFIYCVLSLVTGVALERLDND